MSSHSDYAHTHAGLGITCMHRKRLKGCHKRQAHRGITSCLVSSSLLPPTLVIMYVQHTLTADKYLPRPVLLGSRPVNKAMS